ncbi:beta-ketoacyl synthase N-terminal-like domain-containing protein [Allokutzneria oryzae]|uniref:Beta-ketoacyl synthase N-terminal-like domain-containing protein n=1 Tax=Allokutzneria oryzae TaxID=1378989 RepID=A0ABV5ZQK0_9PSEU
MGFDPIAIVGRGCVLPDALDPDTFWDNIAARRCSLAPVPEGRWRLPHRWALGTVEDHLDRTWTDVGGYVSGFESVFDPTGFLVAPQEILGLDPLFHWVLYGAQQALRESGHDGPLPRAGLVLGTLSYPTSAGAAFAEQVWRSKGDRPDARNRFSSGLPAHFAAKALGLGAGAFALDAACASSLYAIKFACDRLHDGTADLMVAGAVNRADNLFQHIGLCGLELVSRTSRSRPFHRDADGLMHGEGAGFVSLMRLHDALAAAAPVLGVIRGIGLSNDGRGDGPLSPAREGQERAMRLAYSMAGISPETVSLVECHAAGTRLGDAVEARAMASVFADNADLPIGSVKSNIGHVLAPAGAGGLLKVLGAMRAGVRPATLGADEPLAELDGTPLRVLTEAEPWEGPRRAAVSAFGFGGANAHLIVDAWDGASAAVAGPVPVTPNESVAIVAIGARVGDGGSTADFRTAVVEGQVRGPAVEITAPLTVTSARPQQVLVLEAAHEAVRGLTLPRERTMVLIGTGVDPEIARAGARWRVGPWLEEAGLLDPERLRLARDAFAEPATTDWVADTLPNLVATRVNAQLDLGGPSCAVSAEEASGLVALDLAARALRAGEADAALVGAVDLSHEAVHRAALAELGLPEDTGDAAVVLVLKRLADARRDGDPVLAVLDDTESEPDLVVGEEGFDPARLVGRAHAAQGLVSVAAAVTLLRDTAEVVVHPMEASAARVQLRAPRLCVFSGADRAEVLAALDAGRESDVGPARLVLVADGEFEALRAAARRWLTGSGARPAGARYRDTPIGGELGFVYTNGSAAYQGMGRSLLRALPALAQEPVDPGEGVLGKIWSAAWLATVHTGLSRGLLGLRPSAAIGYSSGETAALTALGAWPDVAGLCRDTWESGLFTTELTGELRAVRRAWERVGVRGNQWSSYLVAASAERVRAELADEPAVHLMAVNAPDVCVVGGEAAACAAAVARLGAGAIPVGYDLAAHAPELAEVRERWRRLHLRSTVEVPGVRFYSAASTRSYALTAESAADAVTAQGVGMIDFAGTVERAWEDGVRVFVEHGPRGLCTGWIKRVLGERDHVAVALDSPSGGVRQLCLAVAELVAAGVAVDAAALFEHLRRPAPEVAEDVPTTSLPAHPEITLPPLDVVAAPEPAVVLESAPEPEVLAVPATVVAPEPEPEAVVVPEVAVVLVPEVVAEPAVVLEGAVPEVAVASEPEVVAEAVVEPVRETVVAPEPEPEPEAVAVPEAAAVPATAVVPVPEVPVPPGAVDVRPLIALQTHRVTALHQEVIAQHVQAHQQFLRARADLVSGLARAAAVQMSASPLTVEAPAAPPAPVVVPHSEIPSEPAVDAERPEEVAEQPVESRPSVVESVLDPSIDTWVTDHCPTWTIPALPMMSVVDRLARAAADYTGLAVLAVHDVRLQRWILVPEALRLRTEVIETGDGLTVKLLVRQESATASRSGFEELATATVVVGAQREPEPERFEPLPDGVREREPYESAGLFHGPAFQYVTSWEIGSAGAYGVLDAGRGTVPRGCLGQGVLDGAVQVIPHKDLARWVPEIGEGHVGFPWRVDSLELFGDLPDTGEVEVAARFAGFDDENGLFPVTELQLWRCDRVLAALRVVDVVLPAGGMAAGSLAERRDFLGPNREANGLGLSTTTNGITRLSTGDVEIVDWLPGTVADVWGLPAGCRVADHVEVIAVKDHVGRIAGAHPSTVEVGGDLRTAVVAGRTHHVEVTRARDKITVRSVDAD